MRDVPVTPVDDLLDRRDGYIVVGRQGPSGQVAVTRYDGAERPLGHVAFSGAEGIKVLAALAAVLESQERDFEGRYQEYLESARRNVGGGR